jgi:RelA/SpoT family (p)ppGpp synthetase
MREKKLRFKDVLDREGFRVVVEKKSQCYLAIGVLHALWKPLPGFFKDYIAIPKVNGYQSLHTAVLNEKGDPMEVQVRTKQMHSRAEDGVASHWIYKSKRDGEVTSDGWVWLQSLLDIQASSSHAEDYLEHVKTDLLSDEVYVFTPSGEVIGLPRGASVLDFAFGIHSDVGLKALGATVNGDPSSLSKRLRSGDIVSISTGQEIQAQPIWLSFAKTGRAKAHIRSKLRLQELPKSMAMGKALLMHALSQLGVSREIIEAEQAWTKTSKRFGCGRADIMALIGRGSLSAVAVAQVLGKGARDAKASGGLLPILIGGEESEIVKMAHCCSPLPPQAIVGDLGQEFGMMVHRRDCAVMHKSILKGQHVDVAWEEAALTQSFSTSLKVKAKNQRGTLGRLAALIASKECDVNNVRVTGNSVDDDKALIDFDVQVRSKFHLDRVLEALAKDDGVVNVF